jgi:RNA polymerase sigma-70 factor (ECF subfamily)
MRSQSGTLTDEQLAREARQGSVLAFEALVYRYELRIFRFVLQLCRNWADAEELTQETFVRAFQAIKQFDDRRPFCPWIFTIARRKCIDRYRAEPAAATAPLPEEPDYQTPAEILAQCDERDDLWRRARQGLPDKQFQALWLRYAEDMDVIEIARVLRTNRTHVKVLLFRARRSLGRLLPAHRPTSSQTTQGSQRRNELNALKAALKPSDISLVL